MLTSTPTPPLLLVELVDNGSSFWDSPFVSVLGALIGVIAGAGLTFWFGSIQDKRTAKRELSHRFLDQVQDGSFAVTAAATRMVNVLAHLVNIFTSTPKAQMGQSTQRDVRTLYVDLAAARNELYVANERLFLIAPRGLRDKSTAIIDAAEEIGDDPVNLKELKEYTSKIASLRDEYAAATRKVLGVMDEKKRTP